MVAVAGKVVVVTGGRRGLGAALVDEVLARGARKVYSTARAAYTDDRKQVVTHQLQVRSPDSVAALAEIATDAEIVFNNAGVLLPESLLTGSFEHVTETFDVNVFGPLRVTRAFAPILAANGGGAVVNMHSVLSWLGGAGAYGASKAAMWSVTNSLRAELERQNTQVVGVHAGFIDTDMVSAIPVPKMTPAEVAQRIVAGLEDGAVEVLTDDITINVKAALSGPVERLKPSHWLSDQGNRGALNCHATMDDSSHPRDLQRGGKTSARIADHRSLRADRVAPVLRGHDLQRDAARGFLCRRGTDPDRGSHPHRPHRPARHRQGKPRTDHPLDQAHTASLHGKA